MWIERTVLVGNKHGLHMRPATAFINLANQFEAEIEIRKDERTVNGKSIMEILTLGAEKGSRLVLRADGRDAEDALRALADLVTGNFGENE